MEGNLLASIIKTNEKIQEYLSEDFDLSQNTNTKEKPKVVTTNSTTNGSNNNTTDNNSSPDESLFDERFIVSIIGAKKRRSDTAMTKQFFIVYEISITRIADGHTKSVFRRFREIRAFYKEVHSL
jgi:hypothetical protein